MNKIILNLFVTLCILNEGVAEDPIEIGSRRELFVDKALIHRTTGQLSLRLHHPIPRETVLVYDAPWEGNSTNYHCIFKDGDRFRMYYLTRNVSFQNKQLRVEGLRFCLVESEDGVHWRRPNLGTHEFDGSTDNNIVMVQADVDPFNARMGAPAIFRDENPDVSPDARYKTFISSKSPIGMIPMKSPDGIHWTPMSDKPVITNGSFDSMNLGYWDAVRGQYRAYWRYFSAGETTDEKWEPAGIRAIRTSVSKDFLNWETGFDLQYQDGHEIEMYENIIYPYHRAPHLKIGFPVRYVDRAGAPSTSDPSGADQADAARIAKWPRSLKALPDFKSRSERATLSERFGTALTEGMLICSRDGVHFHRWEEGFLRPGIERPGTWNYGHQFIAWHAVETPSSLKGAPNELSLYATEGGWQGEGKTLRRYTLRLDGFVSAHASAKGGILLTRPLEYHGDRLSLNFSTSAAGSVRVELQDERGKPISGFSLADCDELFGDTVERTVSWQGKTDVTSAAGKTVRLKFELRDADVYAFQFQEEPN